MMNEMELKINKKFEGAWWDDKPYVVLFGGAGSGKSFFAAQKILLRTLEEEDNRTLVVMKIGSRLRQYAFQTMLDVINLYNLRDLFTWTWAPLEIMCTENGNKIMFTGLDDPENIKSIPGIHNIWIEEATSLNRRDFEQLNLRLRGTSKYYKQILLTFNPIDKSNWLYKDFFRDAKYNPAGIYHSTFKDNEYIGDDYEFRIRQSCKNNPIQMTVYFDGNWGERTNNLIFQNWKIDPSIPTNFEDYKTKYAGVDFGWNDPNVLLGIGTIEENIYIFKEYFKRQRTLKDFIEDIKKIVPRNILIIADARSPGNIQEMKQQRMYVKASDKSPNSIMAGINFLKSKQILIHPDCKNTIDEMSAYSFLYDEDNATYFDKPTAGNEHTIDTLRYACDPLRFKKVAVPGVRIF